METTKLYVEYIVVGMETLAIIFLVIFIIIGNAFLPIIKYCIKNIVPSIIMLGWCYILGLIVDRIADIIYDKRKMHIKEKYPIVAETSIIVWEHFKQDAFATFTLSRIIDGNFHLPFLHSDFFGKSEWGGGERHWGQGSGHAGPMLRPHRYEKTPGQQKAIRAQKLQYSLTE